MAAQDDALQEVVTALLDLVGQRGEVSREGGLVLRIPDEHPGVMLHVRLGDTDLAAALLDHHGKERKFLGIRLPQRRGGIDVLEGAVVLPGDRPPRARIRDMDRAVGAEFEAGDFVLHHVGLVEIGHKTVGYGLVVGAELHREAVAEAKGQQVVAILDLRPLVERGVDRLVDRTAPGVAQARGDAEGAAVEELHGDLRRFEDRRIVARHRIGEPVSCPHGDGELSVGGFQRVAFLGKERQHAAEQQQGQQDRSGAGHVVCFNINGVQSKYFYKDNTLSEFFFVS